MEYDLSKIYEVLTDGENFEDAEPGKTVDIKGNIDGFPIPRGGKLTYLVFDVTGPELKIQYGDTVVEVGRKYIAVNPCSSFTAARNPNSSDIENMKSLFDFLDDNLIGEPDE